jgi:hypothetical protein
LRNMFQITPIVKNILKMPSGCSESTFYGAL